MCIILGRDCAISHDGHMLPSRAMEVQAELSSLIFTTTHTFQVVTSLCSNTWYSYCGITGYLVFLQADKRRDDDKYAWTLEFYTISSFQRIHYLGKQGKTKRFPTAGWQANEHVPSTNKGGYGSCVLSGKRFVSQDLSDISDDSLYAQ